MVYRPISKFWVQIFKPFFEIITELLLNLIWDKYLDKAKIEITPMKSRIKMNIVQNKIFNFVKKSIISLIALTNAATSLSTLLHHCLFSLSTLC